MAGFPAVLAERDHLRSAGRPDEVDAGVVEEMVRDGVVGVGDHLDGAGRQARRLTRIPKDLGRAFGAAHRPRRRAEQDGVASLGGDDGLEEHGRRGVGDRRDGHDDTDRFGEPLEARFGVLVDHSD